MINNPNNRLYNRISIYSKLIISLYIVVTFLSLPGCYGVPITYYDATTYTQLTFLKAEMTLLVKSFDIKPIIENEDNIERVKLNLYKAYEYELGKGDSNSTTVKQLEKIIGLFEDDIQEYLNEGPQELGEDYFGEASTVLGQAFDIAIATENIKNRDKH